ncbi:dienelactone hydrolase family protein [Methylobacterium soli]|uniref:Dienelactone hydrolase domain-containing protein n=1 Tax=Methylobacterium soli TaxID=553447 RepID=A0A6L3SZU5_9HYPH|nr:dienelactone hydrolase family protein [Methylobacterium soli]KAB1077904.1 hypothetical protein F6X53_17000 [Methylobacterium soli]GJE45921.1 hypothetical protein AEGHOMDF_5121 [Methylobacterium soli]
MWLEFNRATLLGLSDASLSGHEPACVGGDILAVLDIILREPGIDARRVVVAGSSFGGWNALGGGALNDPRVRGIVNFYGGVQAESCHASGEALRNGAAALGARSRTPSIWFYGDNDHLFPRPTRQAMVRAYRAAGGQAQLVPFGRFLFDSHKLLSFPEGIPVFAPSLDAFLSHLGLPARLTHPEYLPLTSPPASGYARIDDVAAVPDLTEPARASYRSFLAQPFPRAFVIAPGKLAVHRSGGFDPLARCLAECRARSAECHAYAVDDRVVWTPQSPAL